MSVVKGFLQYRVDSNMMMVLSTMSLRLAMVMTGTTILSMIVFYGKISTIETIPMTVETVVEKR
jgi:hypothetical protein